MSWEREDSRRRKMSERRTFKNSIERVLSAKEAQASSSRSAKLTRTNFGRWELLAADRVGGFWTVSNSTWLAAYTERGHVRFSETEKTARAALAREVQQEKMQG
jgi:hypothetical protein